MKRASKAEATTARRKRVEADLESEPAAKAVAKAAIKAKAEKKGKSKAQAKDSGGHESSATPASGRRFDVRRSTSAVPCFSMPGVRPGNHE